eukprot:SM000053S17395  [mRNA]  locus=s53:119409:119928:- [translate_table: standard]
MVEINQENVLKVAGIAAVGAALYYFFGTHEGKAEGQKFLGKGQSGLDKAETKTKEFGNRAASAGDSLKQDAKNTWNDAKR